jgi:GNAT superfamily N-acetyltransferase
MAKEDVPGAEQVWYAASSAMRTVHHLPVESRTPEIVQRLEERIAHLLSTDPDGSWVAIDEDGGRVVGLSQAFVREDLWVLSLLGVSPVCQDRGTGKALLEAALGYGRKTPVGLILCSRDPRAARRYTLAGFDLHPAITAWGRVKRERLRPPFPEVREGTAADAGLVARLDRRLRGGPHGPDLEHLLGEGCRLLVLPDRGYAVARVAEPVFLAAVDEPSATDLLLAVLAGAGDDEVVEIGWLTASQQWAIRVALEVGLELHPVGPVMTRGLDTPPAPYLPSGAFG